MLFISLQRYQVHCVITTKTSILPHQRHYSLHHTNGHHLIHLLYSTWQWRKVGKYSFITFTKESWGSNCFLILGFKILNPDCLEYIYHRNQGNFLFIDQDRHSDHSDSGICSLPWNAEHHPSKNIHFYTSSYQVLYNGHGWKCMLPGRYLYCTQVPFQSNGERRSTHASLGQKVTQCHISYFNNIHLFQNLN